MVKQKSISRFQLTLKRLFIFSSWWYPKGQGFRDWLPRKTNSNPLQSSCKINSGKVSLVSGVDPNFFWETPPGENSSFRIVGLCQEKSQEGLKGRQVWVSYIRKHLEKHIGEFRDKAVPSLSRRREAIRVPSYHFHHCMFAKLICPHPWLCKPSRSRLTLKRLRLPQCITGKAFMASCTLRAHVSNHAIHLLISSVASVVYEFLRPQGL